MSALEKSSLNGIDNKRDINDPAIFDKSYLLNVYFCKLTLIYIVYSYAMCLCTEVDFRDLSLLKPGKIELAMAWIVIRGLRRSL